MAFKVVTEKCVNCGSCDPSCPVQAISEKDGARFIDEGTCISCGSCAGTCPTGAIIEG